MCRPMDESGPDDPGGPPPAPAAAAQEPMPPPVKAVLVQLFFFPLVVAALGAGLFFLLSAAVGGTKTPEEYLADLRSPHPSRRGAAQMELPLLLMQKGEDGERLRSDPAFRRALIESFRGTRDPGMRAYLAEFLALLPADEAVPPLVEALGDDEPKTATHAALALARLKDARALGPLLALSRHDDAWRRQAAVYALKEFRAPEATARLREAIHDRSPDVAWNATLSLANHGDPAAGGPLLRMLSRDAYAALRFPPPGGAGEERPLGPEEIDELLVGAVTNAPKVRAPGLREAVERLSRGDPSLKVRDRALRALRDWDRKD